MMQFIILTLLSIATAGALGGKIHNKEDRIIGGSDIPIEQYPYNVALLYNGTFYCGGTIIALNRILTTASCVRDVDTSLLSVRVGSSKYDSGGDVFKIRLVRIHPKSSNADYDAAVLFLEKNLRAGSSIKVAKLQRSGKEVETGSSAIISGWGYITANRLVPYPVSEDLKGATVFIVDQKKCVEAYKEQYNVTDRMVCGAAEGKDACYRDIGGPMVDLDANLIGIISWGIGCANPKYPGVYTKISNAEVNNFIVDSLK